MSYVQTTECFYCAVGLKVETQNLASHKQWCGIYWGDCMQDVAALMLVIAAFFARETQDFASLQAGAIVINVGNGMMLQAGKEK